MQRVQLRMNACEQQLKEMSTQLNDVRASSYSARIPVLHALFLSENTQKCNVIPSINRMAMPTNTHTHTHTPIDSPGTPKVDAKITQLLATGDMARAVRDGFAALLTRVQQLRAKRVHLHLKQQACVRVGI